MDVWTEFRRHFDTDDGSLPEFRLSELSRDQVVAVVRRLTDAGGRLANRPGVVPSFCHIADQRDTPIATLTDAAGFVADGVAEPFHVVLKGACVGERNIPDLGVFVFPDEVCLDYRMGEGWNADSVSAILDLLRDLLALVPEARLGLDTFCEPHEFFASWARYIQQSPPLAKHTP